MPLEIPKCDVDGCDAAVPGLNDGVHMERGVVCMDCVGYNEEHMHWPDQEPKEGRRNHNMCAACEGGE